MWGWVAGLRTNVNAGPNAWLRSHQAANFQDIDQHFGVEALSNKNTGELCTKSKATSLEFQFKTPQASSVSMYVAETESNDTGST